MSEPLTDFSTRVLCLGHEVTATIDGLLRLQNTRDHKKPITLYVVGTTTSTPPLPLGDAVTLCSVIRSLKSPVVTMGLGFLQPTQALVLAAGTGKRWLLKHSLVHLAPMPGMSRLNLGFNGLAQQKNIFETQFEALLAELKLSPSLFQTEQHLDAQQAIENNLADETINAPQPQIKATHYERR